MAKIHALFPRVAAAETVDLQPRVLMLTDIVDSTATFGALGEVAAAQLWAEHDAAARGLLGECPGQEIERGDGFLLVFEQAADAARFAAGYHALLARLSTPLRSRVGIHAGLLRLRANPPDHVHQGARGLDLDGQAKATVARIQSLAQAGQTLISAPAVVGLPDEHPARQSHGYWQLKGLPEPLELFEIGPDAERFAPPPDAEKVWRVVRNGDLWLPARDVPHSLPAERDRFVGRSEYLARAAQALEPARLLSLLGTGGTGKTRLAQRLGWQRLGEHPGGVWFCDLSAATTPDGIVHAAAQGLQLPLGAADPVAQVGDAIAGRGACLVILDNFEQVARHAEATLGRWLQRAPQARFLVTTREVLGIPGEHTLALPPLPQDEGETLLRERAAQSGALSFEHDDEAAVPELVRLLDGLPLAIELAASRMRVMGPAELLPRMNQRFKLLASRSGRPDRQATLRATLDWSWELLTEPERSALAQLSVFEGGFTLEAAQAVVDLAEFAGSSADDDAHAELWVVDLVQALVEKSLVRRVGERRFDLLRSVQDYASTHLMTPGTLERLVDVRTRHVHFFAALGSRELDHDARVELDNVMAAFRGASEAEMTRSLLPLLEVAWSVLGQIGPVSAAVSIAEVAVQKLEVDGVRLADALRILGTVNYRLGRTSAAMAAMRKGLEAAQAPGRREQLIRLRCAISEPLMRSGQRGAALQQLDQALAEALGIFDPGLLQLLHNNRGHYFLECGDFDSALRSYQLALEHALATGNKRLQAGVLGNLGAVSYSKGELDRAARLLTEALAAIEYVGDMQWEGNTRGNLGLALVDLGRPEEAQMHFQVALRISRHLGSRRQESVVLCNQGIACMRQGELVGATRAFESCMDLARAIGDQALLAEASLRAGATALALRNGISAQTMLAQAKDAFLEMGDLAGQVLADAVEATRLHMAGHSDQAADLMRETTAVWTGRIGRPPEDLQRELQGLGVKAASP